VVKKERKEMLFYTPRQCCPFHSHFKKKPYLTFLKRLSHFLKKLISTKEKAFLHHQKRFSQEKKVIKKKEKKFFSTHRLKSSNTNETLGHTPL
jgi:hypothetical protein